MIQNDEVLPEQSTQDNGDHDKPAIVTLVGKASSGALGLLRGIWRSAVAFPVQSGLNTAYEAYRALLRPELLPHNKRQIIKDLIATSEGGDAYKALQYVDDLTPGERLLLIDKFDSIHAYFALLNISHLTTEERLKLIARIDAPRAHLLLCGVKWSCSTGERTALKAALIAKADRAYAALALHAVTDLTPEERNALVLR